MTEENKSGVNSDVPVGAPTTASGFSLSPAVAILIAGLLIAGSIVFVNLYPSEPTIAQNGDLPPNADVPPPSAEDHIVGSPDAPIVLIEYSDFQCPYCKMVHPTLKRIVEESNGEIAWVYRHLPLESIHPEARPAALAAECIAEQLGNDGFWKFADGVYGNQDKMNAAYYRQLAKEFGANESQFASCISSAKYGDKVDKEAKDAQENGATGTPFTVIAGKDLQVPISGALPYPQFSAVIKAVKDRQ